MTYAQFLDALPLAILTLVIGIFIGCVLTRIEQRLLEDKRRGADFDRAAREESARMGAHGCAEES